jgi:hypothetical protein
MVSKLTQQEFESVRSCVDSPELFKELFVRINGEDNSSVRKYAYKRLQDAKPIFLSCAPPERKVSEFVPSKGQKLKGETDLECAYREFLEETGIDLRLVPHEITQTENMGITTHSGLRYSNHYFLVEVEDEIEVPSSGQDESEVRQVMWI